VAAVSAAVVAAVADRGLGERTARPPVCGRPRVLATAAPRSRTLCLTLLLQIACKFGKLSEGAWSSSHQTSNIDAQHLWTGATA